VALKTAAGYRTAGDSYFPEVFARYGRHARAYQGILEIANPRSSNYARRETAFAPIGAQLESA